MSHQVNQLQVNKKTSNPPNMLSISAFLSNNSTYSDNSNPNPSPNPNPNPSPNPNPNPNHFK